MILTIDTSDQNTVRLQLVGDTVEKSHTFTTDFNFSERLPEEIKRFLAKNRVKLKELTQIATLAGPGQFSRARTAVAVANGLIFALELKQPPLQASYSQAPNITLSSKKSLK